MARRWFSISHWQLMQLLATAVCCLLGVLALYRPGTHSLLRYTSQVRPYAFPHGGDRLFPAYRVVALYGEPDVPALGALGEQSLGGSIQRVKDMARQYEVPGAPPVLPAFEIIATIASDSSMPDGSYSRAVDIKKLATWVSRARQAGVYVVLDLQPGRSDFLTQAEAFVPLLSQSNVGLALDPEWRLGPGQVPLEQIGSVDITEVNRTIAWLAGLTKQKQLPQKLLLLHEFRPSMISNRQALETSYTELAYAIQMDGQGSQPDKMNSWEAITSDPPKPNVYFGWKNFFSKDAPMRSPKETLRLIPQPQYVSYQ